MSSSMGLGSPACLQPPAPANQQPGEGARSDVGEPIPLTGPTSVEREAGRQARWRTSRAVGRRRPAPLACSRSDSACRVEGTPCWAAHWSNRVGEHRMAATLSARRCSLYAIVAAVGSIAWEGGRYSALPPSKAGGRRRVGGRRRQVGGGRPLDVGATVSIGYVVLLRVPGKDESKAGRCKRCRRPPPLACQQLDRDWKRGGTAENRGGQSRTCVDVDLLRWLLQSTGRTNSSPPSILQSIQLHCLLHKLGPVPAPAVGAAVSPPGGASAALQSLPEWSPPLWPRRWLASQAAACSRAVWGWPPGPSPCGALPASSTPPLPPLRCGW